MKPALETGNILTEPIGYIESCFSAKNGTPRQPTICNFSRACLRIRKSVFNNPEHSIMGLEQFSHIWVLFVFHKNGHLSCKAKVQPPRLNGKKTGIFSTRSPHRPNAIGLTLAKLDKIEGGTIYLSGIDMIDGTPVLDIKPYIADYDSPQNLIEPLDELSLQEREQTQKDLPHSINTAGNYEQQQRTEDFRPQYHSTEGKHPEDQTTEEKYLKNKDSMEVKWPLNKCRSTKADCVLETRTNQSSNRDGRQIDLPQPKEGIDNRLSVVEGGTATQANSSGTQHLSSVGVSAPASSVPSWVKDSPVTTLEVRFTPHAEMDLEHFSSEDVSITSFKYFRSVKEAKCAIIAVLAADPRSVYRRKHCQDRLFYFSMDTAHITCWFGKLYAVGGYDGASRQCLSTVEQYNPATNEWTYVADMSTRRSGAGVGVLSGQLYATGGHDGPLVRKSVEVYDPGTNTWKQVADMNMCRRNAGVCAVNGLLYVVGGDDGSCNLASVEYYNPVSDKWTLLPTNMSTGRSYAGVAVIHKPL